MLRTTNPWHREAALAVVCALIVVASAAEKKSLPTVQKAIPAKTPAAPRNADAQKLHAEALTFFQKGDIERALTGFQSVLELEPDNVPVLINLALVQQRLKRFSDAEQHLFRIIRGDPKSGAAWLILGIAAYEQDKLDAAHAHLAQAILHAPRNAQAHQYLGVVLGRKGWYSAGEEELRRAIEINPEFADAHYNLAVLYMERIPPASELARRHYTRSLECGAPPDPVLAKKLDR